MIREDNKRLQEIVSAVAESGIKLKEALQVEWTSNSAVRKRALGTIADSEELEAWLESMSINFEQDMQYACDPCLLDKFLYPIPREQHQELESLMESKRKLEDRLAAKKTELRRSEKRLFALNSVRPSYMDEYEKLLTQIQTL